MPYSAELSKLEFFSNLIFSQVTLNLETSELKVSARKSYIDYKKLFDRDKPSFFFSNFEYEHKMTIWNEKMPSENNNSSESFDLNGGKTFPLSKFRISDINYFVLKIMVECKENVSFRRRKFYRHFN